MQNEFERGGRGSLENTAQFLYVSCKIVPNSNQNCIKKSYTDGEVHLGRVNKE
jgi:hypothetical protein